MTERRKAEKSALTLLQFSRSYAILKIEERLLYDEGA